MPQPTEAAIRARAYELWDRNGRVDGRDIDYWLQAARELEEEDRLTGLPDDGPLADGLDASAIDDAEMTPLASDGGLPESPDSSPLDYASDQGKPTASSVPRTGKEKRGMNGRLRA
ncbi:MAG: DUF2934 domain-containing protein [Bauldia sp.]